MKKRLVSMILAGAMVLGLAACGSGGADDTKAETGAETGAATEAVTEAEGTEGGAETPAAAGTEGKKAKEDLVIGVSWKTFQEERWVRELEIMQKVCDEQGIKMIYQVSEYDAMKQANQIENLVSQGIDILIVTSNEKETVSNAMKAAADAGVFVCYYEATSGECYAQFSGGNEEYAIGKQITEAVADMGLPEKWPSSTATRRAARESRNSTTACTIPWKRKTVTLKSSVSSGRPTGIPPSPCPTRRTGLPPMATSWRPSCA